MLKNDSTLDKWMNGIAYEVAFWNNVYRWPHTFKGLMGWSGYNSCIRLEGFDANSFLVNTKGRKVLDVGCGMSYATGNYLADGETRIPLDIHYVDPLAHFFNNILSRYRRSVPVIEFGVMEYLSAYYPNHDIDLVVIQNALDHSANPIKGILEAMETLNEKGVLYLNHHPNEAETERYKGFHQYNITEEAGELIIWNEQNKWNISQLIKSFADMQVSRHDNGHVIAIIRKTSNVPASLRNAKEYQMPLSQTRMESNIEHKKLSSDIHFRLNYWKYNILQFFVQALPWKIKMGVKKFIGQA